MVSQPLMLSPRPASSGAACSHRWRRLPGSIGLFRCVLCADRGVCPGCLNSLQVALVAWDAGFVVLWCVDHNHAQGGVGDET